MVSLVPLVIATRVCGITSLNFYSSYFQKHPDTEPGLVLLSNLFAMTIFKTCDH